MTTSAPGTSLPDRLRDVAPAPLWSLYNRAIEASRPDGVLRDPVAVELFRALDYPAEGLFGEPRQSHALRAVCFDDAMRRVLAEHPGGTVVALGEGFETGFWRIDDGRVRWLSVDLPPVVALRDELLPAHPRVRNLARSALDLSWMDEVEDSADGGPVLVTTQGLLMHFDPGEALGLIEACSRRFPGGAMIFDSVPRWFSRKTTREAGRPGNHQDALPFALNVDEIEQLTDRIPRIRSTTRLELPAGRPDRREQLVAAATRLPVLRNHRFSVTLARFAPADS